MINFWTCLDLLLQKKALTPKEITAFTSLRILGFLYPMAKAYEFQYGCEIDQEEVLEYAYKVLCAYSPIIL